MHEVRVCVIGTGFALAFLFVTGVGHAQNAPPSPAVEARVASHVADRPNASAELAAKHSSTSRLQVSYAGGQLTIDAVDSTLGAILTKVAALVGAKFQVPTGANSEHLNVVKLGPGPARQVLASLLYGSNFDYFILASDTDPNGIQNLLLTPRGKRDLRSNSPERAAGRGRSPYRVATGATVESQQTPATGTSALPQSVTTTDAGNSLTPVTDLPAQPVLTKAAAQMNRSGLTTEGALHPPTALDRQSIEQQLQQMYQQRAQMNRVISPQATKSTSETIGKH